MLACWRHCRSIRWLTHDNEPVATSVRTCLRSCRGRRYLGSRFRGVRTAAWFRRFSGVWSVAWWSLQIRWVVLAQMGFELAPINLMAALLSEVSARRAQQWELSLGSSRIRSKISAFLLLCYLEFFILCFNFHNFVVDKFVLNLQFVINPHAKHSCLWDLSDLLLWY